MQLRLEDIFKQGLEAFKSKWVKLVINSFLFNFTFAIASVTVLIFMFIAIMLVSILFASLGLLFLLIVIACAVFFSIFFIMFYVLKVRIYILAKSSIEDESLWEVSKSIINKENILVKLTRLDLPFIGATILATLITVIGFEINVGLGFVFLLLQIIMMIGVGFILNAKFEVALYNDAKNLKASYAEVEKKFTKKEIYYIYFVELIIGLIVSLCIRLTLLIPLTWILILVFQFPIYASINYQIIKFVENKFNDDSNLKNDDVSKLNEQITLKNEQLEVTIRRLGAEIKSIRKNNKEYMWQNEEKIWNRTSPVLFPIVGTLKDDTFQVDDEEFKMSRHGFLRDRTFEVVEQSSDYVTFKYTSTLYDYSLYPYDFTVEIKYQIIDSIVKTTYKIINNCNLEMPYQIGAHPAFAVESIDDLEMCFKEQEVYKYTFNDAGLQKTREKVTIENINLSYDMINENIPCFSNFSDSHMVLRNKGQEYIKFNFESMNFLAAWSSEYKNAKFICIEPWSGISSHQDQMDYQLENKDAMNISPANSEEEYSYSFEIC